MFHSKCIELLLLCLLSTNSLYIYSPWEHQLTRANCPSASTLLTVNTYPLTFESCISTFNKDVRAFSGVKTQLEDSINKLSISQKLSALKVHMLATSVSTPTIIENTVDRNTPTNIVQLNESSSITVPIDKLYDKKKNHTCCQTISTSALKAMADRESTDSLSEVKEVQIELIKPHTCKSSGLKIGLLTTSMVEQLKVLENNVAPCSSNDLEGDLHTAMLVKISLACQSVVDNKLDVEGHGLGNVDAELSPTTEEYQEGMHFGDASKDAVDDYDIVNSIRNNCYVPPAPTPTPSMAPLAVLDVDTVEDNLVDKSITVQIVTPSVSKEEEHRRRKKRSLDRKKMYSFGEKEKRNEIASTSIQTNSNGMDHNAICPWEDE